MDKGADLMLLEDLVRNPDSYEQQLLSPASPDFLETLDNMKEFINQLEEINEQWQGKGFTTTAIVEAPKRIARLRTRYEQGYDAMLSYVREEFETKEKELSGLEACVFERKRHEIDELVELYKGLQSLSVSETPRTLAKIEKYMEFSEEIAALDARFDELVEYYEKSKLKSETEVALLQHDFAELAKEYKSRVSRFRPRFSFRGTIFDSPRIPELERLASELDYTRRNLKEASKAKQDLQRRINGLRKDLDYLSSDKVSLMRLGKISPEEIDYDLLSYYPFFRRLIGTYNNLREEVMDKVVETRERLLEAEMIVEPKTRPVTKSAEERLELSEIPAHKTPLVTKRPPGSRPFIRNEGKFFDLPTYLDFIGFPPANYLMMMNIILGRTEESDWIERLDMLSGKIKGLGPATSTQELDYLYHFYHALSEDMNRGNMDHLISRNTGHREVARKTLSELSDYIKASEKSLGLEPEQIKAHQVNAPQNSYNRN